MMRKLVLRYEWLIAGGGLIALVSLLNVAGVTNIDSDLFWTMAGLALALESIMEWIVGRREERLLLEADLNSDLQQLAELMNEDPMAATVTIIHSGVGHTLPFFSFRSLLVSDYLKARKDPETEEEP